VSHSSLHPHSNMSLPASTAARLLLVEDDIGLATLLAGLLTDAGYSCDPVNAGNQGLERLRVNDYELALLDYSLPGMAADELITTARAGGRMPPFIIMTGHGDERVAVECMKLGARDYLVKDTTLLHRLPAAVARALEDLAVKRQLEQSEKALHENEAHYRSLFEGNHAVMLIVDPDTGSIVDANPAACRYYGWDRNAFRSKRIFEIDASRSEEVSAGMKAARSASGGHFLLSHRRADASVRDVEVYSGAIELGGRELLYCIIHDITERKRAEEKLKKTQGELLHASRLAGMAEVATGVLHNVGNVLNSVNVSTSLVSDQLKQSKIANLARAAALMREHSSDLGAYLTHDPKGQRLPLYLSQLAEYLIQEQAVLLKELGLLRKNVEHIRDIVATQQGYAKVTAAIEVVRATDLVEDALRMNMDSLERHSVQVIRDYAPEHLPEIKVAKHKVLQILVNLIRNAEYACDESGRTDKRVTVCVTNGGDHLRISVIDNGVGIPPENLPRIFTHGFTTRKNGHGFGLHSSVFATREIGAALRAHSEGPGQGATFTLELPLAPATQ
jgi:PAS domain S-box-containing protein